MDPHARLSTRIGLTGILIGLRLVIDPPGDDLLPINRVLIIFDGARIVIWVSVSLKHHRR
ncbi:hypothetical protein ADL19_05590 [Streptomyces purpurogeneiscleroticus]|nr:hypothetical protein ADL19_05590 [Streptomyces purpurogeneiscleroticus]